MGFKFGCHFLTQNCPFSGTHAIRKIQLESISIFKKYRGLKQFLAEDPHRAALARSNEIFAVFELLAHHLS
jgi:pyoverdine/dityrosine biosynthesis protein Dit1